MDGGRAGWRRAEDSTRSLRLQHACARALSSAFTRASCSLGPQGAVPLQGGPPLQYERVVGLTFVDAVRVGGAARPAGRAVGCGAAGWVRWTAPLQVASRVAALPASKAATTSWHLCFRLAAGGAVAGSVAGRSARGHPGGRAVPAAAGRPAQGGGCRRRPLRRLGAAGTGLPRLLPPESSPCRTCACPPTQPPHSTLLRPRPPAGLPPPGARGAASGAPAA